MKWPHRETKRQPDEALRDAEELTDQLEDRADRVSESLLERFRRNNFAEGIAMSWGQAPRQRRGGV